MLLLDDGRQPQRRRVVSASHQRTHDGGAKGGRAQQELIEAIWVAAEMRTDAAHIHAGRHGRGSELGQLRAIVHLRLRGGFAARGEIENEK